MIEFENVTKRYGRARALDGLSLSVKDDGIYCLLGRNGAGKTTLMKLIAGHINASGGTITVGGAAVRKGRQPACVNFVENEATQFNLRVGELIAAAGTLQDDFDAEFAGHMAERFELDTGKRYKHLSFGMKTMLTTIVTLANNSRVILLDEPTLGFDAIMRDHWAVLLRESFERRPRIIIVSTHLIDEIAKVTQRLVIIDKGKILVHTDICDIDERAYVLTGPAAAVEPLLPRLNCIATEAVGAMLAAYVYGERITPPEGVLAGKLSLQDFFVKLVGGQNRKEIA